MKAITLRIGAGIAVAALVATGAAAEVKKYGKHGEGWQVELGIDATSAEKIGYMAAFAKTDLPAGPDEAIPVDFEVGGEMFKGEAFGEKLSLFRKMEGFHGAWVPVNNPEFIYDLAKKEMMKITVEGKDPIDVSLAGTDAAFQAMRECQEAQ